MKWMEWLTRTGHVERRDNVTVIGTAQGSYAVTDPDPGERVIDLGPADQIRSCVRPEEYVYDWQRDGL